MTDANRPLRAVLVERYDELVSQLEKRLSSRDLAREALHDAYLRLESGTEIVNVRRPAGLLLTIAFNLARDRLRSGKRLALFAEIETVLSLADSAPGPAQTVEARSDLEAVEKVLAELPARRRAILLASSKEHLPSREIARQFGLSTRKIDMELKLAREHCARALFGKARK